jgi:hypothetical protein
MNFGSEDCLNRQESFSDFVLGKSGEMKVRFLFDRNQEFGFASTSTNKLPCLLLRRVRLLEFGSN